MARRKGMTAGFIRGLRFGSRMSEVTSIIAAQQAIDSGDFKKEGFDTAEEFVIDGIGYSSMDTFQRHSKSVRMLGSEMTNTLVACGFGWNEMRMIEHVLSDDQKESARKKNVLPIDGKDISLDDKDRIITEVTLLLEQRNSARKAEKSLKKDYDNIDKKHAEKMKPVLAKLETLESLAGIPDTPEKVLNGFERIDKAFVDLEIVIRSFCWKEAKALIEDDPALQAKIEGIQEQMRKRCEALVKDWDAEINGGEA